VTEITEQKNGKLLTGVVKRCCSEQTIKVAVWFLKSHPKYGKTLKLISKFTVHDAGNKAKVGDTVVIRACKPHSKTKTWELETVLA
jgi:small subunit ribosomal protein S17